MDLGGLELGGATGTGSTVPADAAHVAGDAGFPRTLAGLVDGEGGEAGGSDDAAPDAAADDPTAAAASTDAVLLMAIAAPNVAPTADVDGVAGEVELTADAAESAAGSAAGDPTGTVASDVAAGGGSGTVGEPEVVPPAAPVADGVQPSAPSASGAAPAPAGAVAESAAAGSVEAGTPAPDAEDGAALARSAPPAAAPTRGHAAPAHGEKNGHAAVVATATDASADAPTAPPAASTAFATLAAAGRGEGAATHVTGVEAGAAEPARERTAPAGEAGDAPTPGVRVEPPARAPDAPVAAAAASPRGATGWTERFTDVLRLTTARGGTEMRLQMEPDGLGRIDVHIGLHGDGVRAVIVAEHEATRNLIANQQHVLQSALARSDIRLTGLSVDVGQGGGAGAFADADARSAQTTQLAAALRRDADEHAAQVSPAVVAAVAGPGRLSLRV